MNIIINHFGNTFGSPGLPERSQNLANKKNFSWLIFYRLWLVILRRTESNGESNVWCKTDGEKEDRRPNVDVGIEGDGGSDGEGEWSEMVRACAEKGWWACFEKSISVWSEGQEESRTTKEDASGEGEQECWFGEGGCLESSEMESGSWSGVNLVTPIYGDKPGSKLDDDDDDGLQYS